MKTHRVKDSEKSRIKCQTSGCNNQADICEHGEVIGWYYFCDSCHNDNVARYSKQKLRIE